MLVQKVNYFLAVLPVSLFVFFPKGDLLSLQALVPILALMTSFFLLARYHRKSCLSDNAAVMFLFFFSITTLFLISVFFSEITARSIVASSKFIFFALIFFSAYTLSADIESYSLNDYVKKTALIILCLQGVIIVATLNNEAFFDFIWSADKTWSARKTGSMFNPNTLGLMVLNLYALFMIVSPSPIRLKLFTSLLCFTLILLSGSRTSVIAFMVFAPVIIVLAQFRRINIRKFVMTVMLGVLLSLLLAYIMLQVLDKYPSFFPYLARLTELDFQSLSGFLSSVGESSARLGHWMKMWEHFVSASGDIKWLLGLGVADIIRIADNDYLFSFLHWGFLGSVSGYLVYLAAIYFCPRNCQNLRVVLVILLGQLMFFGLMAETFFSWFHPILFWVSAGIAYGSTHRLKMLSQNLSSCTLTS